MVEKMVKELEKKLESCKNKVFPYVDLDMENGDEITVYAPSSWTYGNKDYAVLTDDNQLVQYPDLKEVAKWIINRYCIS